MASIRHISIQNFRGIHALAWRPSEGINCLIGPGDSGKSTILDAMELVLAPRRYVSINEADFHGGTTKHEIAIEVTIGNLDEQLLNIEAYASFLRGFDEKTGKIEDEPGENLEHVLTVRVVVGSDLVPQWALVADRGEENSRDLLAKDRVLLAPTRLGPYANTHLAWGQRSVLNRIGDQRPNTGEALAAARSAAKQAFGNETSALFKDVLDAVEGIAKELAIDGGRKPQALLDTRLVSLGNGQIALHDKNGLPLSNLGTGSSRLLVAGLQRSCAPDGSISLIDELEHGLEPYRIVQLLYSLGSKSTAAENAQVFASTHSPVVLRELKAEQIFVVRRPSADGEKHAVIGLGKSEQSQKTLRACAEAFLTPSVLVCEGKTEVGLIRGLDLCYHDRQKQTLARCGVYAADGGGSDAVNRAVSFARLGYRTAILRDNDVRLSAADRSRLTANNITVFEWDDAKAFEAALFDACPASALEEVLEIAAEAQTTDAIEADIAAVSQGKLTLAACIASAGEETTKAVLAAASTRKGAKGPRNWFKRIEPAEQLGYRVIPKHWHQFGKSFRHTLYEVREWVLEGQTVSN